MNGNATNFSLQISKFQVTAGLALLVEAKVVNGNATALTLLELSFRFLKSLPSKTNSNKYMHFLRMMSYGLQNLFLYNSRNYVIPFIRQQVFPLQREVEGSAVSENSEQSFKGMWMIFWHGGYEGGGQIVPIIAL